jgi:hypothetical protein
LGCERSSSNCVSKNTIIYVGKDGNDGSECGVVNGNPCKTLNYGLDIRNGKNVKVLGGSISLSDTRDISSSALFISGMLFLFLFIFIYFYFYLFLFYFLFYFIFIFLFLFYFFFE